MKRGSVFAWIGALALFGCGAPSIHYHASGPIDAQHELAVRERWSALHAAVTPPPTGIDLYDFSMPPPGLIVAGTVVTAPAGAPFALRGNFQIDYPFGVSMVTASDDVKRIAALGDADVAVCWFRNDVRDSVHAVNGVLAKRSAARKINAGPPDAVKDAAKAAYLLALSRYKAGDYSGALTSFLAADARIPAATPKLGVAMSLDKLGRRDDAIRAYRSFLAAVVDREKFKADIAYAELRIARLSAEATAPANGVAVGGVIGGVVGGAVGRSAGSAAESGDVVPFGANMNIPERLEGRAPAYTVDARAARVEGIVLAKCVIEKSGALSRCNIVSGLPFLDKEVIAALATWRMKPMLVNGSPAAVAYTFAFPFALH